MFVSAGAIGLPAEGRSETKYSSSELARQSHPHRTPRQLAAVMTGDAGNEAKTGNVNKERSPLLQVEAICTGEASGGGRSAWHRHFLV